MTGMPGGQRHCIHSQEVGKPMVLIRLFSAFFFRSLCLLRPHFGYFFSPQLPLSENSFTDTNGQIFPRYSKVGKINFHKSLPCETDRNNILGHNISSFAGD